MVARIIVTSLHIASLQAMVSARQLAWCSRPDCGVCNGLDANAVDKSFLFSQSGGRWSINDVGWSDGADARILRKPQRGAVERWTLKNGGGGWSHPIHIHLVDFQVVKRIDGKRGVLPYEKAALKDVVWLNTGESVDVIARFAPWDGLYMFHCHNLIHEDHEMMAAYNVTALADLDYDEKTRFLDPMDPQYRAKSFSKDDYFQRSGDFGASNIDAKLEFFASFEAYRGDEAEAKLEQYWGTKTLAATSSSSSKISSVASTLTTKTSAATSPAVRSSPLAFEFLKIRTGPEATSGVLVRPVAMFGGPSTRLLCASRKSPVPVSGRLMVGEEGTKDGEEMGGSIKPMVLDWLESKRQSVERVC